MVESKPAPTPFEWAGGMPAFERLTQLFYQRVREHPVLEPVFRRMRAGHEHHVALFLAEIFGGPRTYSEQYGGYPTVIKRHRGRKFTEEQRRAWVALMLECADEAGLPDDPEFRSALVGYLEWGSRHAVRDSHSRDRSEIERPCRPWDWGPGGPPPEAPSRDA